MSTERSLCINGRIFLTWAEDQQLGDRPVALASPQHRIVGLATKLGHITEITQLNAMNV
jgi:hypothetical protein